MSDDKPKRGAPAGACPICGKPTDDKFRPFCSARCKQIDLHRWLGEVYVVPGEEGPANEDEDRGGGQDPGGKD